MVVLSFLELPKDKAGMLRMTGQKGEKKLHPWYCLCAWNYAILGYSTLALNARWDEDILDCQSQASFLIIISC